MNGSCNELLAGACLAEHEYDRISRGHLLYFLQHFSDWTALTDYVRVIMRETNLLSQVNVFLLEPFL